VNQPSSNTRETARDAVTDVLAQVAPGTDPSALAPDADLRLELDLDSMDFLAFVVGLDQRLGVAVPEEDYPQLTTVGSAVDYLVARLPVA
jgi:acyl carrier protein